ncbi:peptidase inhibitor family I36 protein [Streptomyces sp. ODS05-4]|uniref:peptidase inhibitor family I36 protein n=1 Tax=Streptomyces sp. ODS05-4 TaxID=2944939 RepID=UPI00210F181E|nr:peptidase inhibitor family I36 protein [Streptomyces sp. ODS05-4]
MRSTALLLTAAAATLAATATATAAAPTPPTRATTATAMVAAPGQTRLGPCATGQLCLWAKEDFRGARRTHELGTLDVESCVPLPAGATAAALANRTGRPVTTYQSAECAETGEFETYPGGGTWVPQSPYQVRAFKVWET